MLPEQRYLLLLFLPNIVLGVLASTVNDLGGQGREREERNIQLGKK